MMPGWVRTDMGGPEAPVAVEESTDGMAKAIAARQGNAGVFFIDFQGNEIAW
ncbi:C-factor [compost metagenome]